jgi:hypothetical protein
MSESLGRAFEFLVKAPPVGGLRNTYQRFGRAVKRIADRDSLESLLDALGVLS